MDNKPKNIFQKLYTTVFQVNDSPQKIALGVGLGVFLGVIPGTGPIAAVIVAGILRANKAAALLGSLCTNTWLSLVILALSIKCGAYLWQTPADELAGNWAAFIKHFSLKSLVSPEILGLIVPVITGYIFIAAIISLAAYLIIIIILQFKNRSKTHPKTL